MSASNETSRPIAVLRTELRRLEQQEAGARAALTQISDEIDRYRQAIAILEGGGSVRHTPSAQTAPNHKTPFRASAANGMTQLESAERALRAAGRPLPIRELVDQMIATDFPGLTPKKLRGSITRTLDRRVGKRKLIKPEPGVYALPTATGNGAVNLE